MLKNHILLSILCFFTVSSMAQKVIPLYPGKVPNSIENIKNEETVEDNPNGRMRIKNVSQPNLTMYVPQKVKPNGTSVIIFPGGGYSVLAAKHEGIDVAKKFNEIGVTAFVLKYRIPNDKTMVDKTIGPLQDAQQAIKYVREHASELKLKANQIGIMGFSAGGHLASTAGTHFQTPVISNDNNTSLKPDFMILIYPVISFTDSIGHWGSRENLIGKAPAPEKIRLFSNELQVTPKTPPTFLVHAQDDDVVKVDNSLLFYQALTKNKVLAEMYLYQKGGHGFGLNNPKSSISWFNLCSNWLNDNEWLK
ncbi:MAG: alpha/beta hydrolase [Sphingobacteriales bacterium]|nr:alpha/beta hydrolase [Sphingobacteriales bacterium]